MHLSSRIQRFLPFAGIILVAIVLAAPLLQGETLCTDDGALHIYRTVALDRALRDGVLYPRWFPDLAYGYGFPFFVYREPFNYYLIEALHLAGISIPNAFDLVLAGSLGLSGIAMFLFARDIFGVRGGLLAALAYLTAPYTLIGPLTRGNLPEVIAFALMPLILFFFRRLILFERTRDFVAALLSYAALFLTHNISSLLFTPLLIVYVAIVAWAQHAELNWRSSLRRLRYAALAVALALGLTAFFWLPALTEQDAAQVYLTHSTHGNNYAFNFIDPTELLAGPGAFDPNLLNPPLRISFGWVQLALAIAGVLVYRRAGNREQRATIVAAALATILLTLMTLPITQPLWDHLPLIRFVQFPWRFVGRVMLPASLLAAAAFLPARETSRQAAKSQSSFLFTLPSWSMGLVAFVALLCAAPLSYPRTCPTPHDLNIEDVFAYEHATGHIGVDPLGAYLPASVIERPTDSRLEAQYAAGQPIERFDTASLPDGARVIDAQYGPNRAELTIATPVDFTATYLTFAFPGWQAWIDDRPVTIHPTEPLGLIAFDVPAGEHRIRIAFGDSPPRAVADAASLIALLVTVAIVLRVSRIAYRVSHISNPQSPISYLQSLIPLFALFAYVLVKATLVDAGITPLRATRLQGESIAGVEHPLDVTFGDRFQLLGYDVNTATTRPGETIRIDLYWKALRPLDAEYQAEAGIVDAEGWEWSPKHAERPRDYNPYPPAPQWPLDAYAIDSFEVDVLPGTPPGEYALFAQLFDRATLAPLSPSDASAPGRIAAPLGTIQVERATRTFDAAQLRIYGGERHDAGEGLTLLGYNIDRVDTVPGESVLLTFFWQAEQVTARDRTFRVEMVDATGAALAAKELRIGDDYPTSRWNAGEQIISLTAFRVPAATPSGTYHWRGSADGATAFDMQPAFRIVAPERTHRTPQLANRVGAELGDFATLLGFDRIEDRFAPGGSIDLTLYWQARAETDRSYKVFVHLLDAGDGIAAQADAIPGDNARPTTGWLPGEVIADRYLVALPAYLSPGQYRLVAGLYDLETNARLKSKDGSDAVTLETIEIR